MRPSVPESLIPLAIENRPGGLAVVRVDDGRPVLVQNAEPGKRPYIHPLEAPGEAGVLTEDAPSHHPWQHGLYVGLNDVNGSGFWAEGLDPRRADTDGTFDGRIEGVAAAEDGVARWTVGTDYLDRAGGLVFTDRQDWNVTTTAERLELDMTWTLQAPHDVTFAEYAYGGLFLRMPYRANAGGSAFDSEGQSEDGHRARWVAAQLPLPDTGREILAAMLDHPGNPGSPVPWRIDNELGINPAPSISGPWTLAAGVPTTFRYRLAVFAAPVTADVVDEAWQRFAGEAS